MIPTAPAPPTPESMTVRLHESAGFWPWLAPLFWVVLFFLAMAFGYCLGRQDAGRVAQASPAPRIVHRLERRIVIKHTLRSFVHRLVAVGWASWYDCCGSTASGERVDTSSHRCASRTLAFGTRLSIVDLASKRHSWCIVNDRGPYADTAHRILDVMPVVATDLHLSGVDPVKLYLLK